jgi:hypothetical protein
MVASHGASKGDFSQQVNVGGVLAHRIRWQMLISQTPGEPNYPIAPGSPITAKSLTRGFSAPVALNTASPL